MFVSFIGESSTGSSSHRTDSESRENEKSWREKSHSKERTRWKHSPSAENVFEKQLRHPILRQKTLNLLHFVKSDFDFCPNASNEAFKPAKTAPTAQMHERNHFLSRERTAAPSCWYVPLTHHAIIGLRGTIHVEKDELEASKSAMALFDDNYGKDLANATLWLEASEADRDYDEGGGYYSGGGCTDSYCSKSTSLCSTKKFS